MEGRPALPTPQQLCGAFTEAFGTSGPIPPKLCECLRKANTAASPCPNTYKKRKVQPSGPLALQRLHEALATSCTAASAAEPLRSCILNASKQPHVRAVLTEAQIPFISAAQNVNERTQLQVLECAFRGFHTGLCSSKHDRGKATRPCPLIEL